MGSFGIAAQCGAVAVLLPAMLAMCGGGIVDASAASYFFLGLYRARIWIYASTHELRLITAAVTTAPS